MLNFVVINGAFPLNWLWWHISSSKVILLDKFKFSWFALSLFRIWDLNAIVMNLQQLF